ncbi:MAG: trigger factor [Firmicutes bacterium]|nr:trigger factor [Candidatus Fiminaster equi]
MKRVVNKLENSKVEVICDVETALWKEAQEKAFKKLAKNLELKGFRKGSVPEAMARKHIDTGSIFNEAINSMLQPAFDEVLKEEKLQPFARPSVDVTKVSDSELQLKFIVILAPEVKLGNYKGLAIKKDAVKVTEAEVKEAIDKLVAQQASLVVKDGASEKGDTVVIDFVGSVDGKEFDGGKAENYSLELGSNSFVPGFEDQLIGHKAGDNVDVNVTFPEQYVPELAGKKALFKCVVHEVKGKVVPTLDAELIKELNIPDVKDEAGLKAYEEKQLKASKEAKAQNDALNKVLDAIVKEAKVSIADEIIADEVAGMKKNMEDQIQQRGLTIEQYYQITGQKPEDVEKNMKVEAEKNIRTILCMEEIAKAEKLNVSDADVEKEMQSIADTYKMPVEKVKEILGQDMNRFKAELRQRKIQDFLVKENIA